MIRNRPLAPARRLILTRFEGDAADAFSTDDFARFLLHRHCSRPEEALRGSRSGVDTARDVTGGAGRGPRR
jgi:hypothetical protein